ncbi:hypothetical protein YSA_06380 [Pseudomonas putida ND6]|uniref:Uncharacterized protein n=1 Tax=Pseudomonas putida ND6 TaxID=231023 RepID=I3UXI4_PSEPU|nr:hypothetical protein YSA_06380 [Pseudomonas putida ND6]
MWCEDRRTVVGREGPVLAWLEFGGFLDVPQRVSIKNQLVMALSGVESGIAEAQVRATPTHFKCYVKNGENDPLRPGSVRKVLRRRSGKAKTAEEAECTGVHEHSEAVFNAA